MLSTSPSRLVLASQSAIRRAMLDNAGIAHLVCPSQIEEQPIKEAAHSPGEAARQLAEAKAQKVSRERPDDWVIGSDSIVVVDGEMFDKPVGRDEAAAHLRRFSGRTMTLVSAVAIARGGDIDWASVDEAALSVRRLSDEFIAGYLAAEWPAVGHCVGVFRLEGRGVQLFERIVGDHFTILGMPLLPLLAALRARGLAPA